MAIHCFTGGLQDTWIYSIRYNKYIKCIFKTFPQIQQVYFMLIKTHIPSDTTRIFYAYFKHSIRYNKHIWDPGPAVDPSLAVDPRPAGTQARRGPGHSGDPGPAGTRARRGSGPGGDPDLAVPGLSSGRPGERPAVTLPLWPGWPSQSPNKNNSPNSLCSARDARDARLGMLLGVCIRLGMLEPLKPY